MRHEYFAHTSSNCDNEKLIDHLQLTGELAEINGGAFGNGKVCKQLGLLHDVGKRTENFQEVLEGQKFKQDHAIVAALYYYKYGIINYDKGDKRFAVWLKKHIAMLMAAHHSTMYTYDMAGENKIGHGNSSNLSGSINKVFDDANIEKSYGRITCDNGKEMAVADFKEYAEIIKYIDSNNLLLNLSLSDFLPIKDMSLNERMFYMRMLLSCLVDADYSATISYSDDTYLSNYFYNDKFDVDLFLTKFDEYHANLVAGSSDSDINKLRNCVYDNCATKGSQVTGFCTLTAPTGTGKTLALMKFALEQAKAFDKNRIIIVLPFLSIIEQNGDIYKKIFGDDVVLIDDSQTEYTDELRIYSDRWSSPIIVTTSVKFFKTLFSSKATDLRCLHNVANSVVVFDECQTLNTNILNSTIEVLQSLTKYYNTTVLFSTATKPKYESRNKPPDIRNYKKIKNSTKYSKIVVSNMQWAANEIMDDVQCAFDIYDKIKNTKVVYNLHNVSMTYDGLVDYYKNENAALYIFNTIKKAMSMYDACVNVYGEDNCYIITSHFCAVDKSYLIDEINHRLKNGDFIRVVSTQCIEAGVDFDFPAGAREYAPFDSVIQSAGRVNRNGRVEGKFLVFHLDNKNTSRYNSLLNYINASNITSNLADSCDGHLSFYDLTVMDEYFDKLYNLNGNNGDSVDLTNAIHNDNYNLVDKNYEVIDSTGQAIMLVRPIFADSSEFDTLIHEVEDNDYSITKSLMRKLSKYTISCYLNTSDSKLSSVGCSLSMKCGCKLYPTNWYLITNTNFYTRIGFDVKNGSGDCFVI